jgi:uncharacterized protein (DUF1800 family)
MKEMNPLTHAQPPTRAWAPYIPDENAPWNLRRVVHLHRRAGFAATWSEIQRDLADGPKASIDRLLTGKARSQGIPTDFQPIAALLAESAVAARDPARLKAWWVYRMLFGPDPLAERLTLLWHNHFATSNLKVNDLGAMWRQNELFRELARAPFGKLLDRAVRDPALLVWLDAQANRKAHPNENLGRELMELFTLGLGPFSEADVKEAARALTGWSVVDGEFREVPAQHDEGEKTILGRRGRWRTGDLVRILLDHPATADRLATRICELFLGEGIIDAAGVRALAAALREHNLDIGWATETVLRSETFFAERNLGNRILSPVEYLVGTVRALELFDPPPSTLLLAEWSTRLGQDLFYPPNVFGWPGGRAWITTRSVIARANFATALVRGMLTGSSAGWDALALARRHGHGGDLDRAITFYAELLRGTPPSPAWRERLLAALGPKPGLTQETLNRVVAVMLALPEYQLA